MVIPLIHHKLILKPLLSSYLRFFPKQGSPGSVDSSSAPSVLAECSSGGGHGAMSFSVHLFSAAVLSSVSYNNWYEMQWPRRIAFLLTSGVSSQTWIIQVCCKWTLPSPAKRLMCLRLLAGPHRTSPLSIKLTVSDKIQGARNIWSVKLQPDTPKLAQTMKPCASVLCLGPGSWFYKHKESPLCLPCVHALLFSPKWEPRPMEVPPE